MRKALTDRLSQAEALRAVGEMLAAFPNGSPANAKGYIGALAAVLGDYPKSVALRCADPVKGVSRETRFMPTVADIVAFCERETAELRGIVDREDHLEKLAREQRERAEADAVAAAKRAARPTYDDLKAKYGENWGIGGGADDLAAARAANLALIDRANRILFRRECAAAGVDPDKGVSPSLLAILQPQREAAE